MKRFLLLVLIASTLVLNTAQSAERPEIKVMAYNIMQLPMIAGNWDQQQRAAHLPDAIRAMNEQPDVIIFSEVINDYADTAVNDMADMYPYRTPILGQVCHGGDWDSIQGDCSNAVTVVRGGVVIASKYPIVEQHAYVFYNTIFGSADYQANKGAVYAEIDINGYRYHLVGTHLQATHDESADDEHTTRMNQLDEINDWLQQFNISSNEPLIFGGDFNVDFALADQVNDMLQHADTNLWYQFDGTGSYPEDNWMSRSYNYHYGYDMCYNDTLDYVMTHRDHLQPSQPAQQSVIPLKATESWYWYYLYGNWPLCSGDYFHNGYTRDLSDHYPVVATYSY
ncbi:sphingomyelin phosphodiesterase [Kangiella shandongensis]|uniref:sphingomyelin phosphodiesterase n=1 Tax=Kangiella shandongensis TaxID=2763258 RepID=UPI001CBBFE5E|nr:sphingomyelin phosphodiesterase [Kangiella shandongensis]